jgi:hypothetical protein
MIHTVYLDDTYVNIQGLLQEIRHQNEGVRFGNLPVNMGEYMTVEQFRTEAKTSLTNILNKHGIY